MSDAVSYPPQPPASYPPLPPPRPWGPFTAGEIIPRTFAIYRENFAVFFGLSALATALILMLQLPMQLLPAMMAPRHGAAPSAAFAALFLMLPMFLILWLAILYVLSLTYGSMFNALADMRAGRPVSVTSALEQTAPRSLRVLGAYLLVTLRVIGWAILFVTAWIFLFVLVGVLAAVAHIKTPSFTHGSGPPDFAALGAFALVFVLLFLVFLITYIGLIVWLYGRYMLFVPIVLAEGLGAGASIDRSVQLSKGNRGRIYALLVMIILISIVAIVPAVPFIVMGIHAARHPGPHQVILSMAQLLIISIVQMLVTHPISGIGISLCYFDLIARKTPPPIPVVEPEIIPIVEPGTEVPIEEPPTAEDIAPPPAEEPPPINPT